MDGLYFNEIKDGIYDKETLILNLVKYKVNIFTDLLVFVCDNIQMTVEQQQKIDNLFCSLFPIIAIVEISSSYKSSIQSNIFSTFPFCLH